MKAKVMLPRIEMTAGSVKACDEFEAADDDADKAMPIAVQRRQPTGSFSTSGETAAT